MCKVASSPGPFPAFKHCTLSHSGDEIHEKETIYFARPSIDGVLLLLDNNYGQTVYIHPWQRHGCPSIPAWSPLEHQISFP